MGRSKRVGLSFASAFVAEVIVGLAVNAFGERQFRLEGLFGFLWFASCLVFPGWLLATPLVWRQRASVKPSKLFALTGVLIGPFVILALDAYFAIETRSTGADLKWVLIYVGLATAVSSLATALYLGVLHFAERNRIQEKT